MNEITLIIPDLHHRVDQAERIIKEVGADQTIFLGDYFDDFNDTPDMVKHTSEWFVESINKPNRIHLMGNHEMGYSFTYSNFQCSGYDQWKDMQINDIVSRQDWDKLKWFYVLDNTWLLSHGGLHQCHLPDSIKKYKEDKSKFMKEIDGFLDNTIHTSLMNGVVGKESWIFRAGHSRGGSQRIGGITWCDFEREFYPIIGLNQIVGHTPQGLGFPKWCILKHYTNKTSVQELNEVKNPHPETVTHPPYDKIIPTLEQLNDPNRSTNIDLDVWGNTHYSVWNGKTLKVYNYRDM